MEHNAMAVASAPAPSTRPGLLDRISTALYTQPWLLMLLLFALLGVPPFTNMLRIGESFELSLVWVAWAIGLGVVGMLLGVYFGLAMRVIGQIMTRFNDRIVLRILLVGIITGAVGFIWLWPRRISWVTGAGAKERSSSWTT
jgi:hypothetical protein